MNGNLLKKLALPAIMLLAAVPRALPQEPDSEYLRLVERADSAISQTDYSLALDFINKAMRLEPGNPSNLMLLSNAGMLHYYLGEDSLAIETLTDAHRMAPASVTVLQNRARVYAGTGRPSEALNDYRRVIELDSTLVEPYVQMAMLQLRGGDVRGAEEALDKAESAEPSNYDVVVGRALLYSKTNRPAEAIPYLNRLIKKEPLSEYYAERAICRLRTDDVGGAAEDIADGLQIDPDNPDLYTARALLNRRRFREKDAEADARRAIERGANPAYLQALGFKVE